MMRIFAKTLPLPNGSALRLGSACANRYCAAARSSKQRAPIGSAMQLGHQNSVRHSLEHLIGQVPAYVLKHVLVRHLPKHMLEQVPRNRL